MKKYLPIALLSILLLWSCGSDPKLPPTKPTTPKVFAEENNSSLGSYRRTSSVYQRLYEEQVEQHEDLQKIETLLKMLRDSKQDSLFQFDEYTTANNDYYKNVEREILSEIKDTIIAQRIMQLLHDSKKKYKNRIAKHQYLIEEIDNNNVNIKDLHTLLKITTTLPLIELYQKNELPSTTLLKGYINKQEQLIEDINAVK